MPFVKVQIQVGNPLVGTGIKCGLRKTAKSSAKMTVGLSASTAASLDLHDGDGLEILIGEGEHHDLMRLRKNNSAAKDVRIQKRETAKGAWFPVVLGHQPRFVDRSEPARWCTWSRIEEGWVEIELPHWAAETAPRKAAPPTQQAPRPGAPQAGRSVTAAVMGDPPPGRRAMLETIGKVSGK